MTDVCLVTMPYSPTERPSVALGILEACLFHAHIDSTSVYGNLRFAKFIGLDRYTAIEITRAEDLIGEWTFAGVAFPDLQADPDKFFKQIPYLSKELSQLIWAVRVQADRFISDLSESILSLRPRIVGCTSTFQQNCASLALLRRIHEWAPDVITLMGGANCEGRMGLALLQSFPWVDFVVSGEADDLFANLCRMLLNCGRDVAPEQLPFGVYGGNCPSLPLGGFELPHASINDLNHIPIPKYEAYFAELECSSLVNYITPGLPVETSRGCWWGERHHCTFCGLNGSGMRYRSKSPEVVLREFEAMAERYKLRKFEMVDNILDMDYLDSVFVHFKKLEKPYKIFYETKANLKRSQVQRLAEAGVCWLQPGIESLHQGVLDLIHKGTTPLINIQLLKWCREFGIRVSWNFLTGAPGERDDWYVEMSGWLPLISQLQPPQGMEQIRYDRFSPYFSQPEKYDLQLTPYPNYYHVYPVSAEVMADLAYFFVAATNSHHEELSSAERPGQLTVKAQIVKWNKLFWQGLPPILSMSVRKDYILILDTRPCATKRLHKLEGLPAAIYTACDCSRTLEAVLHAVRRDLGTNVSLEDLKSSIDQLVQDNLLVVLNRRYLSLAVQGSIPTLPKGADFPGGHRDVISFDHAACIGQVWQDVTGA